jgi:hypothetical protein
LLRLGLGAETLAAAGVSSAQTGALVQAVRGTFSAETLAARDAAFIAAKQSHDRLRRTVTSGKGSPEDVSALRAAETTLASATSQRDAALTALRSAGLATLSEGQRALVERALANASWRLAPQYLVKDRSEAQWVELRDLLDAKGIHERDAGAPYPSELSSRLAAIDGESEIATAKVALDANLATVQTAWNAAAR